MGLYAVGLDWMTKLVPYPPPRNYRTFLELMLGGDAMLYLISSKLFHSVSGPCPHLVTHK